MNFDRLKKRVKSCNEKLKDIFCGRKCDDCGNRPAHMTRWYRDEDPADTTEVKLKLCWDCSLIRHHFDSGALIDFQGRIIKDDIIHAQLNPEQKIQIAVELFKKKAESVEYGQEE